MTQKRGAWRKRGQNETRNEKKPQNAARFIGGSPKMLGHVFQVNGEQRKRGQFKDTVDTLKIYASENFKKDVRAMESLFGDDIKKTELKEPNEPTPKSGTKEVTKTQMKIYEAKITAYVKDEKSLEDSLTALFNITWGQCSAMMKNRLESIPTYEAMNTDADVAKLLIEIRNISNELQVSANVYDALDEAKGKYFKYFQEFGESNIKHIKNI